MSETPPAFRDETPRHHLRIPRLWADLHRDEPLLVHSGLALLALGVLLPFASLADPRTILGIDPWIKPTKFAISIGIYLITIAALLRPLAQNRTTAFVRGATFIAMAIEEIIIIVQSARGTTSHFNFDTPLDGALFGVMGLAIIVVTIAAVALGVQWWRQRDVATPLVRAGVLLGIGIMLLGSGVGQAMVNNQAHSVGVADAHAETGPLLKWTTNGGDLRAAHFLGLHGLQALPLAALALRAGSRPTTRARWTALFAFAALYAAVTALLYGWAMMGRPLVPL